MATEEQLRAAFAVLDVNQDGQISKEELMTILTNTNGVDALPLSDAEEIMANFDADGSGTLSVQELCTALGALDEAETDKVALDLVNAATRPEIAANLNGEATATLDAVRAEMTNAAVAGNDTSMSWAESFLLGGVAIIGIAGAAAVGVYIYSEHGDEIASLARDGAENLVQVCRDIENAVPKAGFDAKEAALTLFHGLKNATEDHREDLSAALRTSFKEMRERAGDFRAELDRQIEAIPH